MPEAFPLGKRRQAEAPGYERTGPLRRGSSIQSGRLGWRAISFTSAISTFTETKSDGASLIPKKRHGVELLAETDEHAAPAFGADLAPARMSDYSACERVLR